MSHDHPQALPNLFENNVRWAQGKVSADPEFFARLARQQAPKYLWIGCADSRVPANEICGLAPGEMFVHRNVANVVVHTDFNCLSVMQFAIDVLKVSHIIVCGHYGCGGVQAALQDRPHGLIDNWLRHIKDVYRLRAAEIDALPMDKERVNRLCELNVMQQVENVCHTTLVQEAWARGQELCVHGWIYDIHDGLLKDLQVTVERQSQVGEIYRMMRQKTVG
jgi:carbonic anhydrase